jgi:hypothetical protein|nr:MAG TPA: Cag pathogenicity island protein [Caudoviricetes sp.]
MKKELTMSIHEFMEVQRGNLTYKDIRKLRQEENKELDRIAGIILNNPKARRMTITLIASINMAMMEQMVFADAAGEAAARFNQAENTVVNILQIAIGCICTVACLFDLAKCIISKDKGDVWGIVLKYVFIYIGAFATPWVFKLIKDIFSGM